LLHAATAKSVARSLCKAPEALPGELNERRTIGFHRQDH
jgi:hypothetical protein